MADFTQTITNSLNLFAGGPSTLWNAFTWGTGKWGEGSNDFIQDVGKFLSESISSDTSLSFDVLKGIAEALTLTSDPSSESLLDGTGTWSYVFQKPDTNAENRSTGTFSEDSDPSSTWTEGTDPSTSWS